MSEAPATTRVRPRKGDEVEVTIESFAQGGAGVGRGRGGFVVFVQGAVPGDRVRAQIDKAKRAFGEARLTELLEPSPDRIEPRAAHPGAPWQVLPYERQLAKKQQQVTEALTRLGGFEEPPVRRDRARPSSSGTTATSSSTRSAQGDDGDLILGFHRPGRWDLIDPVRDDILASERVDACASG